MSPSEEATCVIASVSVIKEKPFTPPPISPVNMTNPIGQCVIVFNSGLRIEVAESYQQIKDRCGL